MMYIRPKSFKIGDHVRWYNTYSFGRITDIRFHNLKTNFHVVWKDGCGDWGHGDWFTKESLYLVLNGIQHLKRRHGL